MSKLQTLKTSLSQRQRAVLLVLVIVVVFALLSATVFRDQAATALRRISHSENDDFPHNAQATSLYLGLEDNLLICNQTQVQLVSPTGNPRFKESVSMTSPALNAAGEYVVVYDVGGYELLVVSDDELIHQMEMPTEETLISATINDKGWLAVTSKVSGYKAVITVYNPSFEEVLRVRLSSRYISDAVVTPDCRGVYLISPGQSEGAFENTLLFYTFSSREEPTQVVSLGSNVVLSILSSGNCWILGDQSLMILDSSGAITGSYDYQGQYLKMASLQGDDFAALFLSRSASGSAGSLITVNDNGEEIHSLPLEGQATALSAHGNDVAILTTGEIITTNRKLEKYRAEPNQRAIRNIALYNDGSLALVSSASVNLYFPSGEKLINPNDLVEETEQ